MKFSQLALVSAIAVSGSTFAMQSMDDAALSETTGQDGITILIAPPTIAGGYQGRTNGIIIGAAVLHDKDGFAGRLGGGAIVIGDASQANSANAVGTQIGVFGSTPIRVNIDASNGQVGTGLGGTKPMLNIGVSLPGDLLIRTGDISVDGSARAGIPTGAANATIANAATGGTSGNAVKILDSLEIALGGASMNIQLGNTTQFGGFGANAATSNAMIVMSGTITGGLNIAGLGLKDASATLGGVYDATTNPTGLGGTLGISQITITDTGTSAAPVLTLNAGVNVLSDVSAALGGPVSGRGGLMITAGGNASDIMLQNITLGSATSTLGDLELINVQAAGTHIAIMGH